MSVRLQIAAMLFMMIQAVLFFTGLLLVLLTPLAREAMALLPWVVTTTTIVSLPLSWWLAPRLRATTWQRHGTLEALK
ncbi:hypothetical protein [Xanthobacter versatilis]|uniref:hypothetical protein n=1 Tax=Xanthobacter autotrophicus (strain ATCC BAA-1158 / Py2) TaxID=78245 RepID=UPI00372991D2